MAPKYCDITYLPNIFFLIYFERLENAFIGHKTFFLFLLQVKYILQCSQTSAVRSHWVGYQEG